MPSSHEIPVHYWVDVPATLACFFFSEYQRSVGETSGAVRLRKRNGALRSCFALIPSPRLSCFLSHSTVFIFKMAASSYPHMAGMGRITFYISASYEGGSLRIVWPWLHDFLQEGCFLGLILNTVTSDIWMIL